ncbi:hypothetical protein [Endozoicomonas ascidiicola]|uniref:hypothetical protein n=1 Tax=Endozoicomonas ascidiicola TaxID=1698521 RepID=UPI00082FA504|nr:hypothetical protein [Endozoicomonas ascidiicola]
MRDLVLLPLTSLLSKSYWKYLTTLILCIAMGVSGAAWGKIEMISAIMDPIDPDNSTNDGKVNGKVQLTFKLSRDNHACGNQPTHFRLGFSDEAASGGSNGTEGITVWPKGNNGLADSMGANQGGQAYYVTDLSSNKISFNIGQWAGNQTQWPTQSNNTSSEALLSADFDIQIWPEFLENQGTPGIKTIEFYIVGWFGNHKCSYNDSIKVEGTINNNAKVRVSGLKDVSFTEQDLISPNIPKVTQNICVYSNTGAAAINFEGLNSAPGEAFHLSNHAGHIVHYQIWLKHDTGTSWRGSLIRTEGEKPNILLDAHKTSEDCSGRNNNLFTVRLRTDDMGPLPPGIYKDTMTIIVSPR